MFDELSTRLSPAIAEAFFRIGLAILVFAFIWLLRGLVARLLLRPLKSFVARSRTQLDDALLTIVDTPSRLFTLALALELSMRPLGLGPDAWLFLNRLNRMLVVLGVFIGLVNLVEMSAFSRSKLFSFTGLTIEEPLLPFVRTGAKLVFASIALVIVVQIWGYDITGLVAGLGIGGLAISLAAQDTLANLFGFSMIVSDRPFVVGEFIRTPDVEGTVERVGLRSTRVRQRDQALVTLPNSKLANSAVLNWSRLGKRWIDFRLQVTYDAEPEQLVELTNQLRTMLLAREKVDAETVVVHFIEFGAHALEVLVRAYLNEPDWLTFTQEREQVNLEIMRIMKALGLQFAFPSQTLYIENRSLFDGPDPFTPPRPEN